MARVGKLERFAEMREFPHVIEPDGKSLLIQDEPIKGHWRETFFKNPNPIVLELGCGKGEYTVDLARRYPDRNFIGMDIKGNRMWKGATEALKSHLTNVGFLRARIEFIERLFGPGEVEEIWITFPDPQPKKPKKRLSSSVFLNRYRQLLIPGGRVHLKTDNRELFDYTLEVLAMNGIEPLRATADLYASGWEDEILSIRTFYESIFLKAGEKITYLQFALPGNLVLKEPNRSKE
ncbi:MAG: tRNA (guanosine(46)-N7)-methyltransferase TrmB [Bacteroidales bacterium]